MGNPDMAIIDCHTHIGHLPGAVGDIYGPEDLVYIAERENVDFMLASSASATTISQSCGTEEAVDMMDQHGDRLGGMFWINPHDRTWMEDVQTAVEYDFYGIKIHPVLDHYAVDSAALDDVFACASEQSWPILTHADTDGTPMSASRYEPLIRAYRDVVLILAHLRLEAIPLAKRYDSVYVDTTYVDPVRVELGLDVLGPDKILFGSDAAEGFDVGREPGRKRPRRSYADIIEGMRQRGIGDAALEKILYENASEVFNID